MDAPAARPSNAGAPRSTRAARSSEQRNKLNSLLAELSAEAATIEEGGDVGALRAQLKLPANPLLLQPVDELDLAALTSPVAEPARSDVHLTGHRESTPAAEVPAEAPSAADADTDGLRMSVQLEVARAEAEVLSSRVEAELTARIEAEKRLAEAEDEVRFLRAEIQMAGHEKRKPAGPLRRAFLAVTGRRRPVVPANNPKKERLRGVPAADQPGRRWE